MKNKPIQFNYRIFQKWTVLAGLLGLLLFSHRIMLAADEKLDLAAFHRTVQAADPDLAEESFAKDHPYPPSKEEIKQMVNTIVNAAMSVMDQADHWQKHSLQSSALGEVRESLIDTLANVFGNRGLPVPQSRAADLENCTRILIHNHPDDIRLYMILCRVAAALPLAQKQALYEEISRASTPGPARIMAQNALLKLQRVGLPLDFNLTALDGRSVSLSALKGKVVLIDFWATTCIPCVSELPTLKQLYSRYQAQGLEIVGISLDSDKETLIRFIAKEKISWPQYYDPPSATNYLAQTYGINAIPVMWLVDRHGVLRQLNARDDQEKKVAALLKE